MSYKKDSNSISLYKVFSHISLYKNSTNISLYKGANNISLNKGSKIYFNAASMSMETTGRQVGNLES